MGNKLLQCPCLAVHASAFNCSSVCTNALMRHESRRGDCPNMRFTTLCRSDKNDTWLTHRYLTRFLKLTAADCRTEGAAASVAISCTVHVSRRKKRDKQLRCWIEIMNCRTSVDTCVKHNQHQHKGVLTDTAEWKLKRLIRMTLVVTAQGC